MPPAITRTTCIRARAYNLNDFVHPDSESKSGGKKKILKIKKYCRTLVWTKSMIQSFFRANVPFSQEKDFPQSNVPVLLGNARTPEELLSGAPFLRSWLQRSVIFCRETAVLLRGAENIQSTT
jgi:hypothetical protein